MNNQEFKQYLINIHGEYVINNILEKDKLEYVKSKDLWKFIMQYSRKTDISNFCLKDRVMNKLCPISKNPKNQVSTDPNKRVIELQNWAGVLDLESNDGAIRDIMVLGESPIHDVGQYLKEQYKQLSNPILEQISEDIVINPNWGLNLGFRSWKELQNEMDRLESNEKTTAGCAFWIYLGRLFNKNWKYIVKNIYATDLAHCNANKFPDTLKNCAKLHFKEELLTIKPKILIILGHTAGTTLMNLEIDLGFHIEEPEVSLHTDYPFYTHKYPQAGTLQIENYRTKFLVIPHPSPTETTYKMNFDFWKQLSSWFYEFYSP